MPRSRDYRNKLRDIANHVSASEAAVIAPDNLATCEAFCRNVIKLPGARPYNIDDRPWLHAILEDDSDKIYITKGRQVGATTLMLAQILYRVCKHPATTHAFATMTQKAMHDISMDRLRPLMRDSNIKYDTKKDRVTSYHFDNQSILKMMSAHGKFDQTRGQSIDFAYVDEAQSVEIDEVSVFESTMLESEHAKIIIAGTGDWESSPWHRHWLATDQHEWDATLQEWHPNNPDSNVRGYHISREMMPSWNDGIVDAKRAEGWTQARIDTELYGIFTAGAQIPFPHSLLEPCITESPLHTLSTQTHTDKPLYAMIDLAGGGDSWTVITIARGTHIQWYARYDDSDVRGLAAKLQAVIDTWHPDHVISDVGGNIGVLQLLEAQQPVHKIAYGEHPDQVVSYGKAATHDIYAADKSHCLLTVKQWFESQAITIPVPKSHIWCVDHIMAETAQTKTTTSGKSVYRFNNSPGHPDDFLMTLGFLAAWLYAQADDNNPNNHRASVVGTFGPKW